MQVDQASRHACAPAGAHACLLLSHEAEQTPSRAAWNSSHHQSARQDNSSHCILNSAKKFEPGNNLRQACLTQFAYLQHAALAWTADISKCCRTRTGHCCQLMQAKGIAGDALQRSLPVWAGRGDQKSQVCPAEHHSSDQLWPLWAAIRTVNICL